MIRALSAFAFLAVSACGFQPVYGPTSVDVAGGGVIDVAAIQGRTGHRLRQELARTVGPGVPGFEDPAVLTVTLRENFARLAFQPDEAASRTDFVVNVSYKLTDDEGRDLATGGFTEVTSFNVPQEPFGDVAAQTEARERAALLISRRLRERLVVDGRRYEAANADAAAAAP